jgi:hypothetical protein
MSAKSRRITAAMALCLVFTVTQVYVGVGFAGPNSGSGGLPTPGPQQFTAILTTRNNQPISVNGASAISGATILTGATIEAPDQVGATINLGSLGTLDIAPNTKLRLEFDQSGNVTVTLVQGCVILRARKNSTGEIDTSQGTVAKTEQGKGGALDVCFPPGAAAPVVNAGAAAIAGAGVGAAGAAAAGAGGLFGLGTAATVAIVAGGATAVILPLATRGTNPSPTTP